MEPGFAARSEIQASKLRNLPSSLMGCALSTAEWGGLLSFPLLRVRAATWKTSVVVVFPKG